MAKKSTRKKTSGAQPENNNRLFLKEEALRKKAYQAYCSWIAKGKLKTSFNFEIQGNKIYWRTIESYIKNYPLEMDTIHKEFAECKGLEKWETICEQSAEGLNTKANTASLQMVMRNKFGWDKQEKKTVSEMSSEELSDTIRQIANEPRIQASNRSILAAEQSLLDQGQRRESYQIQNESPTASALERSSSLQNSSQSPSAGHDNVFVPPFP